MKVRDLKKYKPLDITELSGSPWNTADKVLGLDENDKVVMAEPEEGAVTPEYVDNAIDQAMEAETARTESTYLKESALDDYATKEYVDEAIGEIDLSDYSTTDEMNQAISGAIAAETARTEATYAKPSQIPSLDGYATEEWVEGKGYLTEHQSLDDYYTKEQVDEAIENVDVSDQLVNYALTTAVTQDIQTAMASETARTEDVYAKKSEVPDLNDYYTKSETDEAIEEAISGISLEGYWTSAETKNYVVSEITGATASETARTESTYAKKSEIPSLDGYATEQYVDEAIADIPQVDLSAYAKTTAVTEDIQTAMGAETARTEDAYVKKSLYTGNDYKRSITRIFSSKYGNYDCLSQWYVEPAGNAKGTGILDIFFKHLNGESIIASMSEIQSKDNIELPTFSDVSTAITGAIETETGRTESTYAKKSEIPSLDGYWTSAQTESAITAATEGLATEAWVTGDTETRIGTAIASETARTDGAYVKVSVMPTFIDNITINGEGDETGMRRNIVRFNTYDSSTGEWAGYRNLYFSVINGESIVSTFAGGVDNIILPTFNDVATAITDAIETETARTESAYAKKGEIPSLDGYWTSAQTENAITAATDDMATETWVGQQGYLTQHQDISGKLDVSVFTGYTGATETVLEGKADVSDIPDVSGFVTSGEVATQIGTAMASETARTESTYLKEHQDISGKLDKTDFNTYTGATETALNGKVDLTTYTAYTGSTATAIAAKQDTLVSGTNIKTINNQSLLGSGNIDIQGGGGGGDNVVELTKAQYEALDPPAADTTYIITDADVVDLNDYAPASGLTELSGTVETISSNYATKQNITARASGYYWPRWNSQGIITGEYRYYVKQQGINGSNYSVIADSSTDHPSIYAPTSKGTAGQVLQSPSSGNEPTWSTYKFAFITQTQYDALSTKDATTIYFITGD